LKCRNCPYFVTLSEGASKCTLTGKRSSANLGCYALDPLEIPETTHYNNPREDEALAIGPNEWFEEY